MCHTFFTFSISSSSEPLYVQNCFSADPEDVLNHFRAGMVSDSRIYVRLHLEDYYTWRHKFCYFSLQYEMPDGHYMGSGWPKHFLFIFHNYCVLRHQTCQNVALWFPKKLCYSLVRIEIKMATLASYCLRPYIFHLQNYYGK